MHHERSAMEFQELIKNRRSCRSFENTPLDEAQLESILDAGRWAPSPLNLQPWEFVVVDDPATKTQIREISENAKQGVLEQKGPGWAAKYEMDFLEQAPVLIVVLANPSKNGLGNYFNQPHGAFQGASACIQNMLLACADMGLASLWFTFFSPEALRPVLGISDQLEIAGILPIGKPKGDLKPVPRKPPRVHRNQYTPKTQNP